MSKSARQGTRRSFKLQHWLLAIFGALLAVLLNLAASALYESGRLLFPQSNVPHDASAKIATLFGLGLIAILLAIFIAYWLAIPAAKSAFGRTKARLYTVDQDSRRCRGLVLTLSPLTKESDKVALSKAKELVTSGDTPRNILAKLCDRAGPVSGWNWQQPLRLLTYNYDTIQIIVFILSYDADKYYRDVSELLHRLGPKDLVITRVPRPILINEYNPVDEALDEAINLSLADSDRSERDICIDITSGTKAYSAAATVKTLNSPVVFSYVYTHDASDNLAAEKQQSGKVVIYDATFDI